MSGRQRGVGDRGEWETEGSGRQRGDYSSDQQEPSSISGITQSPYHSEGRRVPVQPAPGGRTQESRRTEREGGGEREREGGREGGREVGREGGRGGGKEGGRGGREGGRERYTHSQSLHTHNVEFREAEQSIHVCTHLNTPIYRCMSQGRAYCHTLYTGEWKRWMINSISNHYSI